MGDAGALRELEEAGEEGTTNLTNPTNLLMLVPSVWLLGRMGGVLLGSGWGTTDGTENH
jgi:hypothetical protein